MVDTIPGCRLWHVAALLLPLAVGACGSSTPVAEIANTSLADVNTVELDPGTASDASAVEQMDQGNIDMTAGGGDDGDAPLSPGTASSTVNKPAVKTPAAAARGAGEKSSVAADKSPATDQPAHAGPAQADAPPAGGKAE